MMPINSSLALQCVTSQAYNCFIADLDEGGIHKVNQVLQTQRAQRRKEKTHTLR